MRQKITGLTMIDWKQLLWKQATLLCDGAVQIANSKTVFSDSVLSVWEPSVINQSKPGKAGSKGFGIHVISIIWIASMESRWSSSGQFSKDSLR